MYSDELKLIKYTITIDDIGNQIETPINKTVLCKVNSIGRNEFYNAAQSGLKPQYIFTIHGYEYEGENNVEFNNKQYKVMRTFSTSFEEIELTCESVIGK